MTEILQLLWVDNLDNTLWVLAMGALVALSCGWVGHFLLLRRLCFLGDAVSHSIFPGVVLAFLVVSHYSAWPLLLGACTAGALSILLSALIAQKTPLKSDAALGAVFPLFFAFGVVAMSLWAGATDLDLDCVLYGELALIPLKPWAHIGNIAIAPWPVIRMLGLFLGILLLTRLFYKEMLLLCFDPTQVRSSGLPIYTLQICGLLLLCTLMLFSFEAVGSLLAVAMLIFPPATARLLSNRLPKMLGISCLLGLVYIFIGLHLAAYFEASVAPAMVIVAVLLFVLAWASMTWRSMAWRKGKVR